MERPGAVARDDGDADAALAGAVEARRGDYDAPYLAHATMEPMNCTADVRADRVRGLGPDPEPAGHPGDGGRLTGLPTEKVTVHVTHLGCGWGRRSRTEFVEDAVQTSKKVGAPVR